MGGLPHGRMRLDPAITRVNNMSTNRHWYFRWTPRTARITLMYVVVVPGLLLLLAKKTEGKYELRGKRKGDSILEY